MRPKSIPILLSEKDIERFWSKVDKSRDCWIWTASRDRHGYGQFSLDGTSFLAHRVSFVIANGDIDLGLVVDHLCRTRHCVNPAHLRQISDIHNTMIGVGLPALNARKTHCGHGHAFDDGNTWITKEGYRVCRTCNRLAVARYKARKKNAR